MHLTVKSFDQFQVFSFSFQFSLLGSGLWSHKPITHHIYVTTNKLPKLMAKLGHAVGKKKQ